MKMKTQFGTALLISTLLSFCHAEDRSESETMASQLIGRWIAGETMMPQPPKEMWQDIKDISFSTNGIVIWTTTEGGKTKEMKGRFLVHRDDQSARKLPSLFVAPTNYVNPAASSICVLRLSEIEVDLDSRFHPGKVGKVLKAKSKDGKRVVFVRMKKGQPTPTVPK